MSDGPEAPAGPERVIHRFHTWTQLPAQDLLTLRVSLQHSPAAGRGPTIESELLSIVEAELRRRGVHATECTNEEQRNSNGYRNPYISAGMAQAKALLGAILAGNHRVSGTRISTKGPRINLPSTIEPYR